MVAKISAGLLMCRLRGNDLQVLLAHPGGPFFAQKDEGAWTIPKGLVEPDELAVAAARREFEEETGFEIASPELVTLGEVRQKSGKIVHAWAFWGDCDPSLLRSNDFSMEWPPRSGQRQSFPEVDRVDWFDPDDARLKILAAQAPFIDRARAALI
jgi:predicted NUDIX family NTP pyrophosphohydrolase